MEAARIEARAVVKVVAISLAVIAVAVLLAIVVLHVRTETRWVFAALFLALAMLPAVDRVERLRIGSRKVLPRWLAILLVYLGVCLAVWRLRRLDAGAADTPFVMPAGRVVPWVAAGLIVALLARATAQAWLLTGGVMAAASLAFVVNYVRRMRRPESYGPPS